MPRLLALAMTLFVPLVFAGSNKHVPGALRGNVKASNANKSTDWTGQLVIRSSLLSLTATPAGPFQGLVTMLGSVQNLTLIATSGMYSTVPFPTEYVVRQFHQELLEPGNKSEDVITAFVIGDAVNKSYGEGLPISKVVELQQNWYDAGDNSNLGMLTWGVNSKEDVIDSAVLENGDLVVGNIFVNPVQTIEHDLCTWMAKKAVSSGVKKLVCRSADLEGLGICTAIDIEDGELLDPVCETVVVGVCAKFVSMITEQDISDLTDGTLSVDSFCSSIGYGAPGPCNTRRRFWTRRRRDADC
jgi:hypothetical protein